MELPDTVWDAWFVIPDNGSCVVSKLTARVLFLFARDQATRRVVAEPVSKRMCGIPYIAPR